MKLSRRSTVLIVLGFVLLVYFSFHEPRLLLTLERSSGKIPALFEVFHSARGNPTTFMVTSVRDLAFSPDGKRIVTSGPDYNSQGICIKAWDAVTGKHLLTITNTSSYGANVRFSADGKQLVAPSFGGATFWDATSGRAVRTFQSQAITDFVAISPDGKLVAIANWTDQNARVMEIATGREIFTLNSTIHFSDSHPRDIVFSPDSKILACMASDHSNDITLRDTMSGKELGALKGFKHSPGIMEFSANGQRLAAMDCYRVPGQMKIWDVPTRSEVPFTNKFVFYMAQDMAFSPDGNRIALSLAENIVVLDAKSGEVLMTLKGNDGMNGCLRFSPDGTRLASASLLGRQVKIWDVAPKAGGK